MLEFNQLIDRPPLISKVKTKTNEPPLFSPTENRVRQFNTRL